MKTAIPGYVIAILLCHGFTAPLCSQTPLDFNRDIRPILAENCLYCHGQDANKRQGDLRLDDRDGAIAAGAVVPGDTAASSLIQRIHSENPDEQMPPLKSNRKLSVEQKEILTRWIAEGAGYRKHWAFLTPERPPEPAVQKTDWARNPIDRFVLAHLEAVGLQPSPEAARATLSRRAKL